MASDRRGETDPPELAPLLEWLSRGYNHGWYAVETPINRKINLSLCGFIAASSFYQQLWLFESSSLIFFNNVESPPILWLTQNRTNFSC